MASREFQHKVVRKIDDDILYDELARRGILLTMNLGIQVGRMDAAQMEKYHMLPVAVAQQWSRFIGNVLANNGALKMYEQPTDDLTTRVFVCQLHMVHPSFPTVCPPDVKDPSQPATNLMTGVTLPPPVIPQNLGNENKPKSGLII